MNKQDRFVDYYAELGLKPNATADEIRAAYKELIKETHPDKFQTASPRERERAERRAQRLNEAKNTLLDEEKRRQYDALYQQRLSEAMAFAAKAGYDGSSYSEYASRMAEIERWNAAAGARSRVRPLTFVILFLLAAISLFWRFVNPEEFGKPAPAAEVPTVTLPEEIYRAGAALQSIALPNDGKYAAAVASYKGIVMWRTAQPEQMWFGYADTSAVSLAAFDHRLALGTMRGLLHLFELKGDSLILQRTLSAHQSVITSVNFSHDGKLLVTTSWDKTAKVWHAETGELLRTRMGIAFPIYSAVFTGDDKHIAFTNDQQVMVWNWREGQLRNIGLHRKRLLAMDADSNWVLSSGEDRVVRQTHLATGTVRTTQPEPMTITAVAFSPKGHIFATANADGFVRIYSAKTCQKLDVIAAHAPESGKGKATSVKFSPDGLLLYSAGTDSTIKAWDMRPYSTALP
ncbi:MAG: DnaJ domain-containing protein [Chloroherpetonaceae bacterium]|nr:DnaJ domain-containing protein [Chloroherpetonaceae bacterium]MCS7210133.1 DnaJ domain-containing protein [Chloroherpetonaceae bacterium]MDW8019875.1 DnaJ domain-containing protein [Chloroherpetonaceae bacterium]